MQKFFRVHGDNIVECERVIKYVTQAVEPVSLSKRFSSLACLVVDIEFLYGGTSHQWSIEMFPGFAKDNRGQRWDNNIFEALKDNRSFLDETPDVVVTKIEEGLETILFAIEFCSALQAGNQAWQRSGRAYSVGRAKCPYIYIVDFVKYELESKSRKRKALRFPNPAVPYSYISYSKSTDGFVAQAYTKAEEFRKDSTDFTTFEDDWFSESLICEFILGKMNGSNTEETEKRILRNNFNVVTFLAAKSDSMGRFSVEDWKALHETDESIIDFAKNKKERFNFAKKISNKARTDGQRISEFCEIVRDTSIGIGAKDLPFGLIQSNELSEFAKKLSGIYPNIANDFVVIASISGDLIVCMIKGFKPKGDDNRPDRGILPLVAMLASDNMHILTYIYGPLNERNYKLLLANPYRLSEISGFWRVFLALSDFVMLDSPLLGVSGEAVHRFIDNRSLKQQYIEKEASGSLTQIPISSIPNGYHEDDVDTVLHYMFSCLLENTFEGMCNPPGSDWSGLSIYINDCEYRWLSLPRVSENSKRPDHVAEMFTEDGKAILFIIESKEYGNKLEKGIGIALKAYVSWLTSFVPSVCKNASDEWRDADEVIDMEGFTMVSVGAYIDNSKHDNAMIMTKSQCDMLFLFTPDVSEGVWKICIMANSAKPELKSIKQLLESQIESKKDRIRVRI
jgi:hypothetical protein